MKPEWVLDISERSRFLAGKDQSKSANSGAGVPFFFKQWGGINKKKAGRLLEGKTWDEVPVLRAG
jgi:protein gp37